MGLLGQSFDDPKSAAILALAGNMVRGDFGGGLLGANTAYQGAQDGLLKRQDLAQQIQLRNIALQQQQQEWAAIQPALAAYAARQAGGGAPAAPSQPAIPPTAGGPLGSGTAGIDIGGQPARSAAPAGGAGNPGAPGQFGMDNILQGRIINMFGGAPAASAFWESQKLPDAVKTNNYYGLDPAGVRAAMLREQAAKGQMLVRQGSTLGQTGADGSFNPMFTAPDTKDNANITWVNGKPQAEQIPGLLPGIQGVARATASGKASVDPYAGLDAQGRPLPVTNRLAAATQGDAPPMTPAQADAQSTPGQRAAGDVASLQREIAGVQRSLVPAATKQMQLQVLNQELAKAQAGAQAPAASGAIYAAPPLGAVKSTDAAQTAPATLMKDSYSGLQAHASMAPSALDAIHKMQDLAAKKNALFTAGVLGTNQSAVNPDAAEYEKQRANLIAIMGQQSGGGVTDAGRANIGESVPDFGKPKPAIADGLGTLESQIVARQLKGTFLTPYFQAGDSKKYTELENQFDRNISPALVPILTMPPGPQRAQALKAAAQNPTVKARLNWAAENGLLK